MILVLATGTESRDIGFRNTLGLVGTGGGGESLCGKKSCLRLFCFRTFDLVGARSVCDARSPGVCDMVGTAMDTEVGSGGTGGGDSVLVGLDLLANSEVSEKVRRRLLSLARAVSVVVSREPRIGGVSSWTYVGSNVFCDDADSVSGSTQAEERSLAGGGDTSEDSAVTAVLLVTVALLMTGSSSDMEMTVSTAVDVSCTVISRILESSTVKPGCTA